MKTNLTKRLAALGIASICAVGALTGCATTQTPDTTAPQTSENATTSTPQQTSPMGQRKMISVDGDRYVFLNNGEAFTLDEDQLGAQVGEQDGGTLYTLKNFNKGFRMAFKHGDTFYMVENVGKSDDSAIDISKYMETADLKARLIYTDIFDHVGMNILSSLSTEDANTILDLMATATISDLETADYEAIAKAQSEGLSYRVEFMLDDHTSFVSYVIPSMNYVTIGDYTCTVENLDEQVGHLFEGLEAPESIIYN